MRILRSQYLESQHNTGGHLLYLNNNGFGKNILNAENNNGNDKEAVTAGRSSMTLRGRKRDDCLKSSSDANQTNIHISFEHFDESLKKFNVVEFIDMDALWWLTKVYKTYENELWHKKARFNVSSKKKWFFYCGLCSNVYNSFCSLKSHLNLHFDIYPYACKLCVKKYTRRKSATYHLRTAHNLSRSQYSDFLTS